MAVQIENQKYRERLIKLQAAIRYGEGDLSGSRNLVEQNLSEDPESIVNLGCLLYREGNYEQACQHFQQAMQTLGFQPTIAYNIALCYYQTKQYAQSLKYIADVIEYLEILNGPSYSDKYQQDDL
ncbi:Tetratricopeptide repeat protein 30A [Fasciola gigantica]|uniref:Tetratricopeptide repeat protein 30 n=1 Tax=Fasciola gigantica TaxID=46835 RepID=A0A504YME7_FASGI|nr:Tetratricopeptide repeat protein 30A [Fasciola gigantica]